MVGDVVMPEHVHSLVDESTADSPEDTKFPRTKELTVFMARHFW